MFLQAIERSLYFSTLIAIIRRFDGCLGRRHACYKHVWLQISPQRILFKEYADMRTSTCIDIYYI